MVPVHAYLAVSALIFTLGVLTVLLKRGAISILMGIEMMLNAGNLAFVAFARHHGGPDGQVVVSSRWPSPPRRPRSAWASSSRCSGSGGRRTWTR